ncbi:hypothetical protein ATO10_07282 [Actibacterium atlanticum]|uniref:DUF306 domain-containing protein n=1 Tax=Actibacterium atlanticum TaxID=1461693 RepID=A0A058ZKT7_9RHOB|nr:META domain-containing protein [Actibacterium atlanticum]KCV82173.1 hypothetical protein ATO10_07282 [Actibacterium atlanticum]
MKHLATIISLLALSACQADETISGYADPAATYVLEQINGTAFKARATIQFPEEGRISGEAPCNIYSGSQTAPYPWFAPGPMMSTKRACPDLAAESLYFEALSEMTLAEVSGNLLILTNDSGNEMLFRAR